MGCAETLNPADEANPAPANYRVLIMERSAPLARLLATGLSAEALDVDVTHDVEAATRLFASRTYQLVIVDTDPLNGSQDGSGMAALERLGARRPDVRLLALGGQAGIAGLVNALDRGADDFLSKPFSLLELMARVRALRRRSAMTDQGTPRRSNGLVLFPDQCRVERDGRSIDLTPREFALLEVLMENAGKTMSRATLTQSVWNMAAEANTNIVDVYIKYLRDKIDGNHDEKLIRTIRGLGYVLQA
jgi:DNA-binding response OmpR family regulator